MFHSNENGIESDLKKYLLEKLGKPYFENDKKRNE